MSQPAQKMDKPHLPPYLCAKCRADQTSPRRYFMDTGIDDFYDGVVYLCDSCLEDIAKTAGLYTQDQLDKFQQENLTVLNEFLELSGKMTIYEIAWQRLTGQSLSTFFENLEKAVEHGKSSRQPIGTTTRTKSDDSGTKSDDILIKFS